MNIDVNPETAGQTEDEVTAGNAVFYLNGRRTIKTPSSSMISSSRWLNDARVREWIATENLRKNGHDYPLLFGLPTLIQAIDDVQHVERVEELAAAERKINPEFDRWMSAGFASTYSKEDLRQYPEGSVGRNLFNYMDEFDLSSELNSRILENPDWKPANTLDYWNLRMGQTHDLYHIIGEVGFGTVAEYFVIGITTGNCFRHLSPDLAGHLMTTQSLIMFPWFTRTMLHYPAAWPTLWRNITYGYETGEQSDNLFTAKFENIMHLTPAQAREALGWRGFRGPTDSKEASLIFGEGREIIP
jgi:ubiquinone biosynthesis protein COQ4